MTCAVPCVPCLVIFVGDGKQAFWALRTPNLPKPWKGALQLPIGLRAGKKSRTPASLSVTLTRATTRQDSCPLMVVVSLLHGQSFVSLPKTGDH